MRKQGWRPRYYRSSTRQKQQRFTSARHGSRHHNDTRTNQNSTIPDTLAVRLLSSFSVTPGASRETKTGFILRTQATWSVYYETPTMLRAWGAYSRPPMPIYAVVITQMPNINTPTIGRLLRWPLPAFWSSADLETWMLDCHWLIARARPLRITQALTRDIK